MPALGQVQGEVAAAVPGSARSHADQVAPDRGAAGLAVGEAGQGAGGAQQVAADRGQRELGRVGREAAGRWASGPSVQSAKTCSAWAWPRCCSSACSMVNGESVKTAWYRQAVTSSPWPVAASRLRSLDPADDEPGGDGLPLLGGERGVGHFGDLGVGDPAAQLVIPDGPGIADRDPGVLGKAGDRRADLGVGAHGDREARSCLPGRADGRGAVERRVHPDHQRAGAPGCPGGADGFGDHPGGAAGGMGVPAAQPGGGDHRGGQRGTDRRGQHVQGRAPAGPCRRSSCARTPRPAWRARRPVFAGSRYR